MFTNIAQQLYNNSTLYGEALVAPNKKINSYWKQLSTESKILLIIPTIAIKAFTFLAAVFGIIIKATQRNTHFQQLAKVKQIQNHNEAMIKKLRKLHPAPGLEIGRSNSESLAGCETLKISHAGGVFRFLNFNGVPEILNTIKSVEDYTKEGRMVVDITAKMSFKFGYGSRTIKLFVAPPMKDFQLLAKIA